MYIFASVCAVYDTSLCDNYFDALIFPWVYRLYRELTTEVTLSTVLGQQVKVQQGEGTELYSHLSVVLNLLQQARGHFSFIITIGGM